MHADARRYEATPPDIFFDLVFVFAVTQLSHHLLAHLSWRGAAETLVPLAGICGLSFGPRLRLIGSAALMLVGFAAALVPPYVALILAGASLATLAILDRPSCRTALRS